MNERRVRWIAKAVSALTLLVAASQWQVAAAAVSAGNATFRYAVGPNGTTFVRNILESTDTNGSLVSGSPSPLQLVNVASTDSNLVVTRFRNCIMVNISPQASGPLSLQYTVVDGTVVGQPASATGMLTFIGASTSTFVASQDPSCGDPQFQPVANADSAQTRAGQPIAIGVLDNDLPQGNPNRRVILGGAAGADMLFAKTPGGSIQVQTDNRILYTPDPGFSGTDSFAYIIKDYAQPGFEALNVQASVAVNVLAADQPSPTAIITVNGGNSATVRDSDFRPGETVVLGGPLTLDGTTPITQYAWFVAGETTPRPECPGASCTLLLPEGQTAIRLQVTDGQDNSAPGSITVSVVTQAGFAALPTLTPNQASVAQALDRLCTSLTTASAQSEALTNEQRDLVTRCQGIAAAAPADQVRALDELSARDFNSARTQTLLFTNATFAGVMDRLLALRGGARGSSTAGLGVVVDGNAVPLVELQRFAAELLGGAAGADAEPGGLLSDRWGLWTRGNFTFGNKQRSAASEGFEADQLSLVVGLDYRLSPTAVIGTALSFGASSLDFSPRGEGGLDTDSSALAVYGSRYVGKNGYLDASLNAAHSRYDANRRILYSDGMSTVDRTATGSTTGLALSGGLAAGYDFVLKGLTLSPNGSLYFADSSIDGFRERGASGLDLRYDEQTFQSLTANVGLRITYAWSLPFGVVLPYVRGDYVRELQDEVDVFNVRFVNERADAPPVAVRTDTPDKSYWRLSGGFSAQLPFGLSSYLEYQRLQSMQFVTFTDLAMGLRMQYGFK